MLNSKTEALGIIFPNSYDAMVPDLVSERLMASIPFASRYRMCDFILSSMVHSGIDNISIIVRKNYHSLLDHLGAGREWDLVRKNGGLNIVPPFAQKQVKVFEGRIEALESLRGYLLKQPQKYVIMTDANQEWCGCDHDVPQAGNSEGIYPSEQGPHGSVLCTRHERRPRQQDLHQPDRRGGDEFQHECLCGRTRVFDPYDR